MKKSEAESAIRSLCHQWYRENKDSQDDKNPSFMDFYLWLQNNYPQYTEFRTTTSVSYDIEMWFDQEFKQTWRN